MKTLCFSLTLLTLTSNVAFAADSTKPFPELSPTNRVLGVEVTIVNEARDRYQLNAILQNGLELDVVCHSTNILNFMVSGIGAETGLRIYRHDDPQNERSQGYEAWLSLAEKLQLRFSNVHGRFIVDAIPWKLIAVVRTVRDSVLFETYIFEGDGEHKLVNADDWVGPVPKVGDAVVLAFDNHCHWAVEKKGAKVLLDVETLSALEVREKARSRVPISDTSSK